MALRSTPLNLWFSRRDLLLRLILVVAAEASHRRCRHELTDVGQETLAISVTPVGPKRESGIPQAAKDLAAGGHRRRAGLVPRGRVRTRPLLGSAHRHAGRGVLIS